MILISPAEIAEMAEILFSDNMITIRMAWGVAPFLRFLQFLRDFLNIKLSLGFTEQSAV
jgi:hypothetical protein